MKKRWKMPKNAHYSRYCCHCKYWEFEYQMGCAYIGKCYAVDEQHPYQQDAYDPSCDLWKKKGV